MEWLYGELEREASKRAVAEARLAEHEELELAASATIGKLISRVAELEVSYVVVCGAPKECVLDYGLLLLEHGVMQRADEWSRFVSSPFHRRTVRCRRKALAADLEISELVVNNTARAAAGAGGDDDERRGDGRSDAPSSGPTGGGGCLDHTVDASTSASASAPSASLADDLRKAASGAPVDGLWSPSVMGDDDERLLVAGGAGNNGGGGSGAETGAETATATDRTTLATRGGGGGKHKPAEVLLALLCCQAFPVDAAAALEPLSPRTAADGSAEEEGDEGDGGGGGATSRSSTALVRSPHASDGAAVAASPDQRLIRHMLTCGGWEVRGRQRRRSECIWEESARARVCECASVCGGGEGDGGRTIG